MEVVSQTLADAKAAVFGSGGAPKNEEPPSGVTGKGTIESPYDQGNAPEKSSDPSVVNPSDESEAKAGGAPKNDEPPSGITGKGTIDSPYDQGNAPEKSADPTIVIQSDDTTDTKDPVSSPIVSEDSSRSPGIATLPSPNDPLASPSTTLQGSGNPMAEPTPEQEKVIRESRGRDETSQRTTSTMLSPETAKGSGTAATSGNFDAAKSGTRYDRSVSPGQLADGTHVRCSGDRGNTYTPGNKLSDKLKDKFHFGHKK